MPFDFLKRKKEPETAAKTPGPVAIDGVEGIPFDGLTEDWRLVGRMLVEGRLSDALNKRDPIAITDVHWAPVDGSEPLAPAPGLKSVDPYDLVIVLAGDDSLPEMTDAGAERAPRPQGLVRGRARGPALPSRRDHLPLSGVGARKPAQSVVGDVHPGRRSDGHDRRSHRRGWRGVSDPGQPGVPARGRAGRRADRRTTRKVARFPDGRRQLDRPGVATRRGSVPWFGRAG